MIEYNKKNFRLWSTIGINPAIWSIGFAEIVNNEGKVAVFTADLERYSGLGRTFNNYPECCFNLGIAEQNMVGIAAGMAMEGIQTYMTTYAPFMVYRCADQIRHFMGNLHLNMKAVGSAAGFSAGLSGMSLLALSDISFMRSIPEMVVLSPADCAEAIKMMEAMSKIESPVYMRFGGATNIPMVYTDDYDFKIGKAVTLQKGEKIAIIATGTTLVSNAISASKSVKEMTGHNITVVNMHTISPLDVETIKEIAETHENIITVEEHFINGGLGSAVAECLATYSTRANLCVMGVDSINMKMGSRQSMLNQFDLNPAGIVKQVIKMMGKT